MDKHIDAEMIAAAILAAGFAAGQRQPLSGGVLEDNLKEKYVEFLSFVRKHKTAESSAASTAATRTGRSRGSKRKK
jgi:hypothetical protein